MASIPNNGYAAVMAGTNVYSGSNFYGSDCPKTPIVPTDPDDLCNRAFVLGAIPPIPPTPPVTEFSYTNTSNAVVPVGLPTAAGQKLNLLASGDVGGLWSNTGVPTVLGDITAFLILSDGTYLFGIQNGPAFCVIVRTDAAMTTVLGIAGASFTILPSPPSPVITCFAEYGSFFYVGGRFDTLNTFNTSGGGLNIENYNIGRFDLPFTGFPNANQISGSGVGPPAGQYKGFGGIVNTILVYEYISAAPPVMLVGGAFQNTLPFAWAQSPSNLNNLCCITNPQAATGGQFFDNGTNGGFAAINGVVNKIIGIVNDPALANEAYVAGSFTEVGGGTVPYQSIPYLAKLNWGSGTVAAGTRKQPIPNLNNAVMDMCISTFYSSYPQRVLISGNFDLSPYGGSQATSYFEFNGQTTYPAVTPLPPLSNNAGKVYSRGGRDAVLFNNSNVIAWNNTGGASNNSYWNTEVPNTEVSSVVAFEFQTAGVNPYFAVYSGRNYLSTYTPSATSAVATFQLPSARFRLSTAPNNQYQNAVFSAAGGAQVFLSGAELFWSPAGAFTTGLTFT